jgi:predicted nucleic acid-binding Zn ribbon protein
MKHCSNCGERIVEEQQFCRSCGAELFVEQGRRRGFDPRNLILIGLFSMFAGILVALFGGFLGSNTIAFIGGVFALLSLGLMATGGFLNERPRTSRRTASQPTQVENEQPTLEKGDTTNRLPPRPADDHFPASVTEQTTTKLRLK